MPLEAEQNMITLGLVVWARQINNSVNDIFYHAPFLLMQGMINC